MERPYRCRQMGLDKKRSTVTFNTNENICSHLINVFFFFFFQQVFGIHSFTHFEDGRFEIQG